MNNVLKNSGVWITWERQTRNRSASSYLEVPLFEILSKSSSRIIRYFYCARKTINILKRHRPRIVFVQNPSVVLSILAILARKFFNFRLVIDAHNAGVYGPERFHYLLTAINRFIIRSADTVLVTNSDLASYVKLVGGTPIVLPDPLPKIQSSLQKNSPSDSRMRAKAFCITSWSDDEPFLEIISACQSFKDQIDIIFSGNYRKIKNSLPSDLPENVHLLGFIGEEDFWNEILSSDFCIDLTKRSDCMVCGAYESVSAEKPIILSNTDVQRQYFQKGVVFCENTREGIVAGIEEMITNLDHYRLEISKLKREILEKERSDRAFLINKFLELEKAQ
ncbi:glycosyltransferase [Marinobacter adhaerens]|uniref:glycosyltransferase n=1 Tax=Marinobacter adhaerens TaxID=1033846 RepID=UPI001C59742D|nr:glycosyltransferase [Marinobacter adhaerens]MBW3225627.1 hypothetical protein [Marinobacter adhaerens]